MIINDLILVLKDDIINDDTLYFGCKPIIIFLIGEALIKIKYYDELVFLFF